jgi:hypothetical protein
MKKSISISLSVLMILGMVHFSVAKHYCSEMGVTSKISLSGKLASCGMEETTESCPVSGINLTSYCCDDVVNFYGIDSNYITSLSVVPEFYQYTFQVYNVHAGLPVTSADFIKTSYTSVNPPGVLMSTNVDLSGICVFRI